MPTYQYRCTECGLDSEVVQKFTDSALTECTNCGGRLRKIFNAVGVVFKGSGFYRTDSRSGGDPSDAKSEGSTDSKGADKSGEKSGGDTKTAPASGAGSNGSTDKAGSTSDSSGGGQKPAPSAAPSSSSTGPKVPAA